MKMFLPQIAVNIRRTDLYDFVAPALDNGLFHKPGQIVNIEILAMRDLRNGLVEHHGLVVLDSPRSLHLSLQRLQNKPLNGKPIEVRPYYQRSWYNDPRQSDAPVTGDFVEKRLADRRRGNQLELIKGVSEPIDTLADDMESWRRRPCIANLLVPAAIEGQVIEWIGKQNLKRSALHLTPELNARGRHEAADELEVAGGRKLLQLLAEYGELQRLLARMRRKHGGAGIRYWIASVLESGEV